MWPDVYHVITNRKTRTGSKEVQYQVLAKSAGEALDIVRSSTKSSETIVVVRFHLAISRLRGERYVVQPKSRMTT